MGNSIWHREVSKDEIKLDALRKYIVETIDDGDDNLALACEAFADAYDEYVSHSDFYKEEVERERAKAAETVVAAVTEDRK